MGKDGSRAFHPTVPGSVVLDKTAHLPAERFVVFLFCIVFQEWLVQVAITGSRASTAIQTWNEARGCGSGPASCHILVTLRSCAIGTHYIPIQSRFLSNRLPPEPISSPAQAKKKQHGAGNGWDVFQVWQRQQTKQACSTGEEEQEASPARQESGSHGCNTKRDGTDPDHERANQSA